MTSNSQAIPTAVRTAVREALRLIEQTRPGTGSAAATLDPDPLPSLLEQCGRLAGIGEAREAEPIRTVHHFACTGGTVLIKCLACSPNIQVLSELDPLSSMTSEATLFTPTDLIQLLQHGNREVSEEEKIELFMAGFSALYDSALGKGLRILIRDHTHSHFCVGDQVPSRPTLRQIIAAKYRTLSVITVRHPLDSWLSLVHNHWVDFNPGTLEEYAKRYLLFLEHYPASRVFKYEDFVEDPDDFLAAICSELRIPEPNDYRELFTAHRFSGDSGRQGSIIEARKRRPVTDEVSAMVSRSTSFRELCGKLGYAI